MPSLPPLDSHPLAKRRRKRPDASRGPGSPARPNMAPRRGHERPAGPASVGRVCVPDKSHLGNRLPKKGNGRHDRCPCKVWRNSLRCSHAAHGRFGARLRAPAGADRRRSDRQIRTITAHQAAAAGGRDHHRHSCHRRPRHPVGQLTCCHRQSFGITNIIALDSERNVIQDQRLLVRRDDAKVVNLQRGTERQTFNCTPQCNPSIVIGDDQKYFDMISKAAQAKIGFSERAADSGAPASSQ